MKRGIFIAFYSANNKGKSTLLKFLQKIFIENEIEHLKIKYPLYNLGSSGQILNEYLRKGNPDCIDSTGAQMQYSKNRIHFQPAVQVLLEAGIHILAEDYLGTGIAWGMATGVSKSFLEKMEQEMIKPDLSFLIIGKRFEQAKEKGHKHEDDKEKMCRAERFHLQLADEFGWIKIKNDKSPEELAKEVWQIFSKKFSELKK